MLTEIVVGGGGGGIGPTEILKLALLSIIQLSALDDDGVGWQVDSPSQRRSRAEHLEATQRIPSATPRDMQLTCTGSRSELTAPYSGQLEEPGRPVTAVTLM